MMNPRQQHLEALRADLRDEIKRRIDQRDKYSIQLTIALAAIVAVSFSQDAFRRALLAAPLVSLYFTVLILYSYRVHRVLAEYLRDRLEPELAKEFAVDVSLEWETYYAGLEVPGIRHTFFVWALRVVTLLSLGFLAFSEWDDKEFIVLLMVAAAGYGVAIVRTTEDLSR